MNGFDAGYDVRAEAMPGLGRLEVAQRTFFHRVFGWMGGGLLLTSLVAVYFGTPERYFSLFGRGAAVPIVLFIVQIGLVVGISAAVRRLSPSVAASLFVVYSALMGLSLSAIFLVYTTGSIVSTFAASGGTFAAAAIYGAVTKKDLTTAGRFLMMAFFGLIIASVVNMFLHSSGMSWLISFVGVFIFIGLAAYDVQKLKDWHRNGIEGTRSDAAVAIGGALTLYLDFLNLFIFMLRLMGQRRE